jgi:F0F1-type ATP synthase membrane subunit b/b'
VGYPIGSRVWRCEEARKEFGMSTGLIIAIAVIALLVLAGLLLLGRTGRQKRLETRRGQAREIRREAEVSRAQADHARAEADERRARARREEAGAREHAAKADARGREARERHLDAARKDPDADEDEVAERFDREHGSERGAGDRSERGAGDGRGAAREDKPSLKERLFGRRGGDEEASESGRVERGKEGTVHEDVRRERDPESDRVRREEVTGRRYER